MVPPYGGRVIDVDPDRQAITLETKPSLEVFIENLDLSFVPELTSAKYSLHGRHINPEPMLKALIVMIVKQIPSRRRLALFLQGEPRYVKMCGFERPPAHNTFSKFIKRLGEDTFKAIFSVLVGIVRRWNGDAGTSVSVDSTSFWAYANPIARIEKKSPNENERQKKGKHEQGRKRKRKKRKRSDKDAQWGYNPYKHGKEGEWIFGYKAQIATDAEREIPLAYLVTPANLYDSPQYKGLLERVRSNGIRSKFFIADPGYDSIANASYTLNRLNAIPIIKKNVRGTKTAANVNKQRTSLDKFVALRLQSDGITWKEIYKRRTSSERVNSRLKKELNSDEVKVRGLWRVSVHVCLNLMAMLCVWLVALKTGLTKFRKRSKYWQH